MCSYLIDTWCLGVKNVIGPKRMNRRELKALTASVLRAVAMSHMITVPLELAQHLVLGAVEFAGRLGFEPHRDFKLARSALGSWEGPSAITFWESTTSPTTSMRPPRKIPAACWRRLSVPLVPEASTTRSRWATQTISAMDTATPLPH